MSGSGPIQMLHSFFPQIELDADPQFGKIEKFEAEMDVTVGTHLHVEDRDQGRWIVGIIVEVSWPDTKTAPYKKIKLSHFGLFKLNMTMNKDVFEKHLTISAPSMLYSGTRTFLKILTNEGPYEPIILPSVQFKHMPVDEDDAVEKSKE